MRPLLLLLPPLNLSVASLPPGYLARPGVILEHIGTVSLIGNYVEIDISLDVLSSCNTVFTYLSLLDQYRHSITSDISLTQHQVTSLLSFLSLFQGDLSPFMDRLPRPHPRRQHRGLFNFMGDITSYLFGIATHDELHNATRQISIYTETNSQLIARELHFALLAHVYLSVLCSLVCGSSSPTTSSLACMVQSCPPLSLPMH